MGVTRKIGRKINNLTGATDRREAKARNQLRTQDLNYRMASDDREDRQAHDREMLERGEAARDREHARSTAGRSQKRSSSRG